MGSRHDVPHVIRMPSPTEDRPASLREAGRRVWLETLHLVSEYGTLVVFSAGAVLLEAFRQRWQLPEPANSTVLAAELVASATMIAPKAIRAMGDILQSMALMVHDVIYAAVHGARRPGRDDS